jgi:hypothetical protein
MQLGLSKRSLQVCFFFANFNPKFLLCFHCLCCLLLMSWYAFIDSAACCLCLGMLSLIMLHVAYVLLCCAYGFPF